MAAEPCSAYYAEPWDGTAPPTGQLNATHWPPGCDYGGYDVEDENGAQGPGDPTLPTARLLIGVALGTTMLVCGVGNVLFCVALLRCRRLRNTTNLLIANLAVSDLVVAAVCCPFELEYYVVRRLTWSHGPRLCAVINYVRAASLYVSTNALLAIAVDRYLVILRPLQPRMARRTTAALLAAVWALSALLAVPAARFSTETALPAASPRDPVQRKFCGQIWPAQSALLYKSYFLTVLSAQFVAPVLAMSFCYACIAKELWFKRVPGHQTEQARRRLRSRRRGVVALVGLLGAFVLCWAPFYGFALVRDFFPAVLLRQRHYITVFYAVQCVAVSNSAVSTVLVVVTLKPDALLAHALRPCLRRGPSGRAAVPPAPAVVATASATAPSSPAGVELKCTAVSDA
ncbi:prokineticin receptor 1-like [Petromyzon marinus]|uniref:Prokineticin receptor 1-like n=1 Tax=Petromyzon marinus TaxID=7757 RepID=A0AAJ7SRU3_PETMA|nr:prokineticin receptor 1-like [Petromyzon marinus]